MNISEIIFKNCDALHNLVVSVQFKKLEKHPWMSVTFNKIAGLLKVTPHHGYFSHFLNCTNGTKSRNTIRTISYGLTKKRVLARIT